MKTLKVNNYYIRDDGLVILVANINTTTFDYKVILHTEFNEIGDHDFEFMSNLYDYMIIDYKKGKRFDKLITQ